MSRVLSKVQRLTRRYSHVARTRGRVIKHVAEAFELVYFGIVSHDDDAEPILGFTTSVTHIDQHYCVGSYDGHNIRIIDRFDTVRSPGVKNHAQNWLIIELTLDDINLPHVVIIPTDIHAREYTKLFTANVRLQPMNSSLLRNHSPEFKGRFQILAPTSRYAEVESILPSPVIAGISARFWPNGIELNKNKVYIYITDRKLTKMSVAATLDSSFWLADKLTD